MTELAAIVDQYGPAVEADLLALPGLRLPDAPLKTLLRTGALSWRRLNLIVDNLKPGSAFHHAVTGSWWTATDMILADLHDLTALPASGKQLKETPTYPRPWVEKAKQERMAARLQAWKQQARR